MKRILSITILCFLCALCVQAQQRTIRGVVKDETGTVPGATVFEKNLISNAVATDVNGRFELTLKGNSQTIVVTFVGLTTQEVSVAGKDEVTVNLATDAKGLDEVIVVGYGTQTKLTNTGAVSSVSGADIRQNPSASIQNTLMGRVPGFTSQQRSGKPGSDGSTFLIRGLSTPNGSGQPLLIVDDIEFRGLFNEIDPDQIESISILKDASTTAIYGVKGANGVVVITTRRGKSGKPQVSFRSEVGIQKPIFMPEYVGSYDAARLVNQALAGDGLPLKYTEQDLELFRNGTDPYGHPDVDWTETLLKPYSLQTRNNLNIQGGVEKVKYFISAGYLWQNGLLKDFETEDSDVNPNYYYKRYNFRSNLDVQATKGLLLNLDLSGNFAEANEPNVGGRDNRNNIFFELSDYNQLPPFAYAPYNPDGSYGALPGSNTIRNNVIGRIALSGYNRSFDNDMMANLRATQKLDFITKGLSAKGVLAYNTRFRFWRSMTRPNQGFPSFGYNPETGVYTPYNPNVTRLEKFNLGYYADGPESYKRLNYQASLHYDRNFGDHHVYALALANEARNLRGVAVPSNERGLTGRVGYDYNRKYLFEFNMGYNGSDRFAEGKRYDFFPAISAGWNIAEEPFFKNNITFVDLLKVRGSFGYTGSDDLSGFQYLYLQVFNRSGSYSIGEVHRNVSGIVEGTLGNENVTWEKERQANLGVDISMFNGKLNITADVFDRFRYQIFQQRGSVSSVIGVGLPPINLGEVKNKGYEAEVRYRDNIGEFDYFVTGNISYAKNRRVEMDEATQPYPWLAFTNNPLGSVLGYTTLGFYTEEDIANPDVAKPASGVTKAGDLKFLDRTGDGVIDPNDRAIMDLPNLPNTILGFTSGFTYKRFSVSATFQSALNFRFRGVGETINPFQSNFREIHLGAWTPENSVNPTYPRITTIQSTSHPGNYPSDYWFIRGDYLRLKTAEIAYNLPTPWANKLKLNGIRVYANGYNLFTWALADENIYQIDPENQSGSDGAGFYPQQKIYNFGVQLNF